MTWEKPFPFLSWSGLSGFRGEKRKKRERRTKIEDHWDTAHNIKKSQDTKKTPRLLAHALWAPTSLVEVELQPPSDQFLREFDQDFSKTLAIPTPALQRYQIHDESIESVNVNLGRPYGVAWVYIVLTWPLNPTAAYGGQYENLVPAMSAPNQNYGGLYSAVLRTEYSVGNLILRHQQPLRLARWISVGDSLRGLYPYSADLRWMLLLYPMKRGRKYINKEYRADQKFFRSSLLTSIKGYVLLASPYDYLLLLQGDWTPLAY
ncbi:hypothetical protein PCH_Pc21g13590 [Penicillium rubens Wisconsin 54-1255]|uniref:Uncharacterized protein n=1 Tax=Penicillium rubens (strain ATCC 28089 / DSM 1075 / NRRL 1951 / Wisconsin 54-1255) TaxID=500485 RepID=B6HNA9_PENRW|nr:hypothetical protein PCH_Pc21g13590 [Penicillium rubens Wisconsin 54-1255]